MDHTRGDDVYLADSMLPDTQHGDAALLRDDPSSVINHRDSAVTLPCFSDSVLLDTQCGSFSSQGIQVQVVAGPDSDTKKSDTQPSETASSIKRHFQASKYMHGNNQSLPDTLSVNISLTTKSALDDKIPDTQLSRSTSLWAFKQDTNSQFHLQSTSQPLLSDDNLPATQVSSFLPGKIAERGGLPDSVLSITPVDSIAGGPVDTFTATTVTSTLPDDIPNAQSWFTLQPYSASQATKSVYDQLPETQSPTHHICYANCRDPSNISATQISINSSTDAKIPLNRISCKERKRIIVSPNRPLNVTKAMREWVSRTNWLLDPFREDDECWLHPSPPPARLSSSGVLRPVGTVQKRFAWKDRNGKHSIVLNYGTVVKLVNYKMTKQQQDGFIDKQWHLSHLCGNWTCLNPSHTTIEPGPINISRNSCFSHRSGCHHTPKCLKDKKAALGPDGKLVDHSDQAATGSMVPGLLGDWSGPLLLDDEDFIMDDFEDEESVGPDDMNQPTSSASQSRDGDNNVVDP
ncbi:hypothetical protein BKA65DRAFT_553502 [Rhexocercosporidium sp. MPI-PUGE-AT-0058]|nr:hypothetical protein BKA65DRAFT_553502 [Rhexocercosporidium sp. MPI-PUGE-AT-0058]